MTRKDLIGDMIKHHRGYLQRYVVNPQKSGYYIEAFCRLDSLIDEMIINVLVLMNPSSEPIILRLADKNAFRPAQVAEVFHFLKVVDNKLLDSLYRFKGCRNFLVHRFHGEFKIALKETGFVDKPGVCTDCAECLKKHLDSLRIDNLDNYSKKVLKKKIELGSKVYYGLENICLKYTKKEK